MDDDEPPTRIKGDIRNSDSSTSLLKIPKKLPDIGKKYPSNGGMSCPLIYYESCPKHNLDADCLGDSRKRKGCHIFIEKAITAPPKGINCNNNILEQLQRKKQHYKKLEQNCINQKTNLEQTRRDYEQAQKNLSTFKEEYFI